MPFKVRYSWLTKHKNRKTVTIKKPLCFVYKNTSIFTLYVTIYWPGTVRTEGLANSQLAKLQVNVFSCLKK